MLGFIKIENFCSVMNFVKRLKRQAKEQNKIYCKHSFHKGFISKLYYSTIEKQATKFYKNEVVFFSF